MILYQIEGWTSFKIFSRLKAENQETVSHAFKYLEFIIILQNNLWRHVCNGILLVFVTCNLTLNIYIDIFITHCVHVNSCMYVHTDLFVICLVTYGLILFLFNIQKIDIRKCTVYVKNAIHGCNFDCQEIYLFSLVSMFFCVVQTLFDCDDIGFLVKFTNIFNQIISYFFLLYFQNLEFSVCSYFFREVIGLILWHMISVLHSLKLISSHCFIGHRFS